MVQLNVSVSNLVIVFFKYVKMSPFLFDNIPIQLSLRIAKVLYALFITVKL